MISILSGSAYLQCSSASLSEINVFLLKTIAQLIGIKTKISLSKDFVLEEGRSRRLLSICRRLEHQFIGQDQLLVPILIMSCLTIMALTLGI